jgi:conjugal transfer/entry exclusion protein
MYANMLRNTKNIPNQRFGSIQADINGEFPGSVRDAR